MLNVIGEAMFVGLAVVCLFLLTAIFSIAGGLCSPPRPAKPENLEESPHNVEC